MITETVLTIAGLAALSLNSITIEKPIMALSEETTVLFSSENQDEIERWKVVNDGVMGGLSTSKVSSDREHFLIFSGDLSLENNGGFASIRANLKDTLPSDYTAFTIRVLGDGRTYQLRLKTNVDHDGIAFKHEFETIKNRWVEITLPFASFSPTFRGRELTNIQLLDSSDIRQIGFLLADKTAGSFTLKVDTIKVIK